MRRGIKTALATGVELAVVASLGDDGTGMNTAEESRVAQAIQWCIDDFSAHIISLSLGGAQNEAMSREGPSVSVVRRAVDNGIFVVAAAGNDGGSDDDGRVSVPSNVPRVISVGASVKGGGVWKNSSLGSQTTSDGEFRTNPNLKPEILAPGENIVSTGIGDTWYTSSGTSDSTVFVSSISIDTPRSTKISTRPQIQMELVLMKLNLHCEEAQLTQTEQFLTIIRQDMVN